MALDSQAGPIDGFTVVDCVSGNDVCRAVWFLPGRELPGDAGVVEAVLRAIRHAAVSDFPPLTQYRLTEAVAS